MPKDPSKLSARLLTPEEVESVDSSKKKTIVVDWLVKQFINPATNEHIAVGQGIEIGPFDTEIEGRNWIKYYLPDAYKVMGWGKAKTKGGHTMSPVSTDLRSRDGKCYMWIMRIRE